MGSCLRGNDGGHLTSIRKMKRPCTLYIEFRPSEVCETRDLAENTLLDLDRNGRLCAITIQHATKHRCNPGYAEL